VKCARCPADATPGKTRCPKCREKDRVENGARYVKRGGWGGARVASPVIVQTREGDTVRLRSRCGASTATNATEESVREVIEAHARECPAAYRRTRVTGERRQMEIGQ